MYCGSTFASEGFSIACCLRIVAGGARKDLRRARGAQGRAPKTRWRAAGAPGGAGPAAAAFAHAPAPGAGDGAPAAVLGRRAPPLRHQPGVVDVEPPVAAEAPQQRPAGHPRRLRLGRRDGHPRT